MQYFRLSSFFFLFSIGYFYSKIVRTPLSHQMPFNKHMTYKKMGFPSGVLFINPKLICRNKGKTVVLAKVRKFPVEVISNIFTIYLPYGKILYFCKFL